jgi:hypothetical protein
MRGIVNSGELNFLKRFGLPLPFASPKNTEKTQIFNQFVAAACQLVLLANLAKKFNKNSMYPS